MELLCGWIAAVLISEEFDFVVGIALKEFLP